MKKYQVKSIFGPTIQGEGSHTGMCVLFLRFAGCNRWSGLEKDRASSFCSFCDTDFRGGEGLSVTEILDRLEAFPGPRRVVITGGEPTLQLDVELLTALKANGYETHLETNGSRALGKLRELLDHVTCSPKQSREETRLEHCDDLKLLYPLQDPAVTLEAFSTFPSKQKLLQPVVDINYASNLRETLKRIYENPDWRLSMQIHKMVGVE